MIATFVFEMTEKALDGFVAWCKDRGQPLSKNEIQQIENKKPRRNTGQPVSYHQTNIINNGRVNTSVHLHQHVHYHQCICKRCQPGR